MKFGKEMGMGGKAKFTSNQQNSRWPTTAASQIHSKSMPIFS